MQFSISATTTLIIAINRINHGLSLLLTNHFHVISDNKLLTTTDTIRSGSNVNMFLRRTSPNGHNMICMNRNSVETSIHSSFNCNIVTTNCNINMQIPSKPSTCKKYQTRLYFSMAHNNNNNNPTSIKANNNYFGSSIRKTTNNGNGYYYMKDSDNDENKEPSPTSDNSNNNKQKVLSLLSNVITRANDNNIKKSYYSKFTENDDYNNNDNVVNPIITDKTIDSTESIGVDNNVNDTINDLLTNTMNHAEEIINTPSNNGVVTEEAIVDKSALKWSYLSQPCVTTTALAHSLWKAILDPMIHNSNDIVVIDATCGNGQDSLVLAEILFPSTATSSTSKKSDNNIDHPLLICIDIQESAIDNTSTKLKEYLGTDKYTNNIRMLCASHGPLVSITNDIINSNKKVVGLICYNLGYLPGTSKNIQTNIETTIQSLAYSAAMIRTYGIISVITYPQSNEDEAIAVLAFMEGLSLLNKDWDNFIRTTLLHDDNDKYIYDIVYNALRYVSDNIARNVDNNNKKHVWRVFEHRPLGRAMSPSLVTATKIQ